MNHLLLFENVLANGTLTSSPGDAAGYPKENVLDWRMPTAYAWKASATTTPAYLAVDLGAGVTSVVDAVAIGAHRAFMPDRGPLRLVYRHIHSVPG